MPEFSPNTLYYGDNLQVLRDFPPECVDLVYLDPPFNSNRSYNVLFRESKGAESEAQIQAFDDTWHWGRVGTTTHEMFHEVVSKGDEVGRMLGAFVEVVGHNDVTAYLTMMTPRLVELRRILKPTGSIYLHCDPTAGHYLKVFMDRIFGADNFIDEIVWNYGTPSGGRTSGQKPVKVHDTILAYAARYGSHLYNRQYTPYSEKYVRDWFRHTDEDGRKYQTSSRGGQIVRQYLDESPGVPLSNVWSDIMQLYGSAGWFPRKNDERLGYPTHKPEALLERIIHASSNPGDVVLDPFCGCGTAVVAAHRLERKWIGIDVTFLAVDLMRNRLATTFPDDFKDGIEVDGEPADEAAALALAERDKYQFQFWAVAKLGGTSRGGQNRKGADQGVDGVLAFPEIDAEKSGAAAVEYKQVVISVKGGSTGPSHVRDLIGTVQNEQAALGALVTVRPPTRAMERAAASAGVYVSAYDGGTYPRVQILTAGDIVAGGRIAMPSRQLPPQYTPAPRAKRGRQERMGLV